MKEKRQLLRFLMIRSELWFRFILVVIAMRFSLDDGKFILTMTGVIGLLWVMNGWGISLEAYRKGRIIPKGIFKKG